MALLPLVLAAPLGVLARGGWLALAFLIWFAGSAAGAVLLLVLEATLSTIIHDFRGRIVATILALIGLSFLVCVVVTLGAVNWVSAQQLAKPDAALPTVVGLHFDNLPFVSAVKKNSSWVFVGAVIGAGLVGLPAVISACSKLAETVMQRITLLQSAFERIAEGDRNVHVEEAGSPEFFSLALSFNEMVDRLYLAERIERAFGQYVSAQVLERIRAQRGAAQLSAQLRTATVFFADIRGFTPISERLAPAVVVDLLNRYLEQIVPVVEAHQGFINKFIGDAVVVVFNGPIDQPDHAARAARCAIAVQQLVTQLNANNVFPEIGELRIGVGVATGPMLCGNIGTKSRLEYTVIGDTVNLASRMTGHARGGDVWVSEDTARGLPAGFAAFASDPIKFKGKDHAIVPYRVWPAAPPAEDEWRR
jgi:adenylate cyclase